MTNSLTDAGLIIRYLKQISSMEISSSLIQESINSYWPILSIKWYEAETMSSLGVLLCKWKLKILLHTYSGPQLSLMASSHLQIWRTKVVIAPGENWLKNSENVWKLAIFATSSTTMTILFPLACDLSLQSSTQTIWSRDARYGFLQPIR